MAIPNSDQPGAARAGPASPAPPVTAGSGAVGELADVQLGCGLAALAERAVPCRLVRAVGRGRLQDVVDLVAAGRVGLLHADAVRLGAERLADHLELARVLLLRGVTGEDDVVGGDRVDLATGESRHALGVRVELLQLRTRVGGLDPLGRRRAGHRADLLAGQALRTGDRRGGRHQQVLTGHVVRAAEVDDLLAVVVDRVRRHHQVDLPLLDVRLAVGGDGGLPLDAAFRHTEALRNDLADLDVETGVCRSGLQAKAGLVGLDADDQLLVVGRLTDDSAGRARTGARARTSGVAAAGRRGHRHGD